MGVAKHVPNRVSCLPESSETLTTDPAAPSWLVILLQLVELLTTPASDLTSCLDRPIITGSPVLAFVPCSRQDPAVALRPYLMLIPIMLNHRTQAHGLACEQQAETLRTSSLVSSSA